MSFVHDVHIFTHVCFNFQIIIMSSFSPLATIITQNKLTGTNFVDWKRNLDILLTAEGHKYVLTTPCPPEPAANASNAVKDIYNWWKKSDELARCYMLGSMSNVLQCQHEKFSTAAELILNLKEMFGEQSRPARQSAMQMVMNTKMSEGTPVREHVLKMIGYLNVLEVLGAEIDGETQVDMILNSLPASFTQYKLNYNMNKLKLSLSELVSSL